jgi:hypothetical protein
MSNINPLLSFCRSSLWGRNYPESPVFHSSSFSYANYASRLCNRFGGGRTFHNVQYLIFRNATEDPAVRFPNSSPMVFPKTSLPFSILFSRGCCFLPRPPILLAVFLPFLRCSGSSTFRLLMPLLHSNFS